MIFMIKKIYPFGDKTICYRDLIDVHVIFFKYFIDAVKSFDFTKLFYNNNVYGGTCIFGSLSSAGCFSIISPLYFLFNDTEKITYYMSYVFIIKCMLASITMYWSLKRLFKDNKEIYNVLYSIIWALSGYVLLNYTSMAWLDIIILFPLLCVGYKNLLDNKGIVLYSIALSLLLMMQIQFSYMILLSIVFFTFFALKYYIDEQNKKQVVLKLGIATVIGLLISCIVFYPTINYVLNANRLDVENDYFLEVIFTKSFYLLSCFLIVYYSIRSIIYFKKDNNIKTLSLGLLFTGVLPLLIDGINRIWHGGSYSGFPFRQSFIPIFIMIILSYYYLINYSDKEKDLIKINNKIILCIFSIVLLIIGFIIEFFCFKLVYDNKIEIVYSFLELYLFLIILLSIIIKYFSLRIIPNSEIKFKMVLLFVFTIVEVFIISFMIVDDNYDTIDWFHYKDDYDLKQVIESNVQINDNYYFKDDGKAFHHNAGLYLNIPFNDSFILINKDIKKANNNLANIGLTGQFFNNKTDNALSDFIRNNKYIITRDDLNIEYFNYKCNLNQYLKLYEYKYDIKNAFKYNKNNKIEKLDNIDYFDGINVISKNYFNIDNIYEKINYSLVYDDSNLAFIDVEFNVDIIGRKEVVFYWMLNDTNNSIVAVQVEKDGISKPMIYSNGINSLGIFNNEKIKITFRMIKTSFNDDFCIYSFNLDKFDEIVNNSETIECTKNNNIINYKVNGTDQDSLFIPLSYDTKWTVSINGEKVKYDRALDGFISVDLVEGENDIRLEYFDSNILIGGVLSIIGIICLIIISKCSNIFTIKILQTIIYIVYYIITIGLLIGVNIGGIILMFIG